LSKRIQFWFTGSRPKQERAKGTIPFNMTIPIVNYTSKIVSIERKQPFFMDDGTTHYYTVKLQDRFGKQFSVSGYVPISMSDDDLKEKARKIAEEYRY